MYLYSQRSPSLAGYRPNQAMQNVYAGYTSPSPTGKQLQPLQGLGAFGDATDPTTWLVGAAALGGLWLLFRSRRGSGGEKRKIARLAAQRALASRSLREEGV